MSDSEITKELDSERRSLIEDVSTIKGDSQLKLLDVQIKNNIEQPHSRTNSISQKVEDDHLSQQPLSLPKQTTPSTLQSPPNITLKKKELTRPLFSRTNTDKMSKPITSNKTMIVETETVDASNVPSVTLPIQNAVINSSHGELLSNNSTISNNLASLRSKKSTLFDPNAQISSNNSNNLNPNLNNNDETNSIINLNGTLTTNDSASVNGSIRGFNKRLVQPEVHTPNIPSKPGATKADLFAAKVANAVGDVSDSDSEETFVYESAPDALNSTNSAKATSGNLNNSALALRKLSQRNISMPITSTTANINIPPVHHAPSLPTINDNHSTINYIPTDNEETDSLLSQHNQSPETLQILQDKNNNDLNPIHSSLDESQASVIDHVIGNQSESLPSVNQDKNGSVAAAATTTTTAANTIIPSQSTDTQSSTNSKPGLESTQVQPLYQPKTRTFTKYTGDVNARKPSSISVFANPKNPNSINSHSHSNQLRTTTSKLFDVKGSSLRRYSGVPDDVNIEDYIDQHDEDEEMGLDDYSDSYDFDDYEEENELTPLNIALSNNKLRSKASKNYFLRNNLQNFRSTDNNTTDTYNDNASAYKEDGASQSRTKSKKYRNKSQQAQRVQEPYSPHNFHNSRKQSKIQTFKNFLYLISFMFLLLAFGFIAGFLLATTKDLQSVSIKTVQDVVVSYDELVFDIFVEAFNPGFVSVSVEEVELDVFARTEFITSNTLNGVGPIDVSDNNNNQIHIISEPTVETVLLGSVEKLEVPLVFASGFFNRNHSVSRASVKLLHPGENSTDTETNENHKLENDTEKWRDIIKHPFNLILKGRLNYELPFFGSKKSVSVTKTVVIDPNAEDIIIGLY